MTFEDFSVTGALYHVVSIIDLEKTLAEGIHFDDKITYFDKYYDFHNYFDKYRTDNIPYWVVRKKAIFASMNFKEDHNWHSHTALLKVKVDTKKCWVCNENKANILFEPFILQNIKGFEEAKKFIEEKGAKMVEEYWLDSLSMDENMRVRRDKEKGYDAEVLIFHDIPPEDIECLFIISDHSIMSPDKWLYYFNTELICPKSPAPKGIGCQRAVKFSMDSTK